jgi:type IV secretory pathway TrbD component
MRRINVITHLVRREPVAFQGCVQAMLAALVGFGVINWSNEQVGLMLGVIAAFLAMFTRAQVRPTTDVVQDDKGLAAAPAVGQGDNVR